MGWGGGGLGGSGSGPPICRSSSPRWRENFSTGSMAWASGLSSSRRPSRKKRRRLMGVSSGIYEGLYTREMAGWWGRQHLTSLPFASGVGWWEILPSLREFDRKFGRYASLG